MKLQIQLWCIVLVSCPACLLAAEPAATAFNVKDFGAAGDGKHDDTQAFKSALAKACAQGGGRVYAPAGTYRIGAAGIVYPCSKLEILGDGDSTIFPIASEFQFSTPDPVSLRAGGLFMSVGNSHIELSEVFVNGSNTIFDGKYFPNQRAVAWASKQDGPQATDLTIQHIRVNGVRSESIYIDSTVPTPTDVRILNNTVTNAEFTGINLNYGIAGEPPPVGFGNVISGNFIDHTGGTCIEGPLSYSVYTNNTVRDCGYFGFGILGRANTVNNGLIANNNVIGTKRKASENGIYMNGTGMRVIGNIISGWANAGIMQTAGDGDMANFNIYSGNTLTNNGNFPGGSGAEILIASGKNAVIADNAFYSQNGTANAIRVNSGSSGTLIGVNSYHGYSLNLLDAVGLSQSVVFADPDGGITQAGVSFSKLGPPVAGKLIYCKDCLVANPCTSRGKGAFAKGLASTWVCN